MMIFILTRAHSDDGASMSTAVATYPVEDSKVKITNIELFLPQVQLSNLHNIRILLQLKRQKPAMTAFRSWGLYENPILPVTKSHIWKVKTLNHLDKPQCAILIGFQTGRNIRREFESI